MKLWLIWQNKNSEYDSYDSAVVAAETEEAARMMHPGRFSSENYDKPWDGQDEGWSSWCAAKDVNVEYLGEAKEGQMADVIVSSFNAG
jgi:hypothetical protein